MSKKQPENELSFRLLVQSVKDYAIFMLAPDGRVATWNEGAHRIKGYLAEEIVGQHVSRFYTPEDLKTGKPARLLKLAESEGRVEDEGWRVRKDGSHFWASVTITALRDDKGVLRGFGKVTRDLTDHKLAEQALHDVSGQVLSAQEKERQRISTALTDSTSPSFAALVSKLYQAKKRVELVEPQTSKLVSESIALAETLSREITTVSYLLHPPRIEGNSLLPSLRWYLDGLSKHRGVAIEVDFPVALEQLPRSIEVALFRVVQECLAGVFAKPGSLHTTVRLATDPQSLTLEVSDKSLTLFPQDLDRLKYGSGELGVGITGMRERIRQLGGSLTVDSASAGTTIRAKLPHSASQSIPAKKIAS